MTDAAALVGGISESDIEGIVSSFRTLLENMNDPDGTIGKLFVDNSLYTSLDDLLDDVDDIGSFDDAMTALDKRRKYYKNRKTKKR